MVKIASKETGNMHKGHRERVKDRFIKDGISSFQDHEALELLLYYAVPQKDTNELAHSLINEFGSLSGVFDASVESLCNVKGVGEHTAVLIKLIPSMYSKYLESSINGGKTVLNTSELSGKFFISKLTPYTNEVLFAAFLDSKLCVKQTAVISEGSSTRTEVSYRKIINCALNYNTPNIIIAHNHPSGVAAPSANDIEAVRQLIRTLSKLDLKLVDSIIVTNDNYYSMASKSKFAYLFD